MRIFKLLKYEISYQNSNIQEKLTISNKFETSRTVKKLFGDELKIVD
jgi:hypothetical protein